MSDRHASGPGLKNNWILGWVIFGFALVLYLPTGLFGFINWDDPAYVYKNEAVLEPAGIWRIWSTTEMPENATNWPLVFTTFWLEYRLTSGDPGVFHLTNAFLHALASGLAFWMLLELGAGRGTAFVAATLFAVHPVQIESVAWVTERKNVLSGVFFFAAMGEYFRYRRLGNGRRYSLAVVWYLLALLSKSSVVALPLLWILADRLVFDGTWRIASLRRAAIPVLLSAASALLALNVDVVASRTLPIAHRPFAMATAVWFYLGKLVNPSEIIPIYERWQIDPLQPIWWVSLFGALLLLALVFWYRRRMDALSIWGLCYFLFMLLPVSGIKPFGYMNYTFVADHFVYLPSLGIFLIIGQGLSLLQRLQTARLARLAPWIIGLAVVSLAFKTLTQIWVWKDDETFWEYTKAASPATAHDVFATAAFRNDDYAAAAENLRTVIEHRPNDVHALTSLGQCLFRSGDWQQGLRYMHQAVEVAPDDWASNFNLGKAYANLGEYLRAEVYFYRAYELDQKHLATRVELAFVYTRLGKLGPASDQFDWLLQRLPGMVLARLGKAEVLVGQRKLDAAMAQLRTLTETSPSFAEGWRQYANLIWRSGDTKRALEVLDQGLKSADEPSSLIWLKADILVSTDETRFRDPVEALRLAEHEAENAIGVLSPAKLAILAKAHAANDQWHQAVTTAERALALARGTLKSEIEADLERYRAKMQ